MHRRSSRWLCIGLSRASTESGQKKRGIETNKISLWCHPVHVAHPPPLTKGLHVSHAFVQKNSPSPSRPLHLILYAVALPAFAFHSFLSFAIRPSFPPTRSTSYSTPYSSFFYLLLLLHQMIPLVLASAAKYFEPFLVCCAVPRNKYWHCVAFIISCLSRKQRWL